VLDEVALRKADVFDEVNSIRIALADSQSWAFPKPWLQIHAAFRGGRAQAAYPVLTYGPEIDELIAAIGEATDAAAQLVGAASLGAYLLTRQYDLTDEQLDQLFAFRPGDDSSYDWVKQVMDVATGESGRRSFPGGSA
jgi:hypothetical protein